MNLKSSQPKVSTEDKHFMSQYLVTYHASILVICFLRFIRGELCYSDSASLAGSVSISFVKRLPVSMLAFGVALASLVI